MSKENPLSIILGAYLKRERNNLRESSSSIAKKLQLGESNYRMIEAGSANFNINRIFLLVRTFPQSALRFERLTKYVTAIQTLDFQLGSNKLLDSLNLLSQMDADLEHFFDTTKDLYQIKYGTEKYKEFLDEVAVKELSSFLGDENYRTKEITTFNDEVLETLLNVPSIELPNILKFLRSLNNRPPLHIGPVAKEWEEDNKDRFQILRGIYLRTDLIINDANLELFQYEYLLGSKFTSMKMLFIDEKQTSATLKRSFIMKLDTLRKKFNKKSFKEVHLRKIEFKVIRPTKENISNLQPLLMGRKDIFPDLNAFWDFYHDSGVEIGFVGGAKFDDRIERNYAINLSYYESLNRAKLFDDIWKTIE